MNGFISGWLGNLIPPLIWPGLLEGRLWIPFSCGIETTLVVPLNNPELPALTVGVAASVLIGAIEAFMELSVCMNFIFFCSTGILLLSIVIVKFTEGSSLKGWVEFWDLSSSCLDSATCSTVTIFDRSSAVFVGEFFIVCKICCELGCSCKVCCIGFVCRIVCGGNSWAGAACIFPCVITGTFDWAIGITKGLFGRVTGVTIGEVAWVTIGWFGCVAVVIIVRVMDGLFVGVSASSLICSVFFNLSSRFFLTSLVLTAFAFFGSCTSDSSK